MSLAIKILLFGAGMAAAVFVLLCALLYFKQDDILFHRVTNDRGLAAHWQAYKVTIPSDDIAIEGWWADNPLAKSDAVVIYFGGNAEDVLYAADSAVQISARRMLVTNYRGCGATPGKPGQQALFKDALAIYDYAVSQPGVSASDVVVMGRSLGSGQATFVAANRLVRGAILITPYDSIAAVAQSHYSYLPVRWLLRNPFPSEEFAPKIKAPVSIIAGGRDGVIPPIHARHLYNAWSGPKEIHVLDTAGHNDISRDLRYYPIINAFLSALDTQATH